MFDRNSCMSKTCSYTDECANHESAGDFRSEGGSRGNISIVDDKLSCDETIIPNCIGMVYLKHEKIMVYDGVYGNDYEWKRQDSSLG